MVCVSGMGTGGPRVQYGLQYNAKNLSWANSAGDPSVQERCMTCESWCAVNHLAIEIAASEKLPAFTELHTSSQYNIRIFKSILMKICNVSYIGKVKLKLN